MSDKSPLLSEADAARVLNISPGTLRNWRSQGRGPEFVKMGAAVRYTEPGLTSFTESRTFHPSPRARAGASGA